MGRGNPKPIATREDAEVMPSQCKKRVISSFLFFDVLFHGSSHHVIPCEKEKTTTCCVTAHKTESILHYELQAVMILEIDNPLPLYLHTFLFQEIAFVISMSISAHKPAKLSI